MITSHAQAQKILLEAGIKKTAVVAEKSKPAVTSHETAKKILEEAEIVPTLSKEGIEAAIEDLNSEENESEEKPKRGRKPKTQEQ